MRSKAPPTKGEEPAHSDLSTPNFAVLRPFVRAPHHGSNLLFERIDIKAGIKRPKVNFMFFVHTLDLPLQE
jgi:hypothetical protein